MAGMTEEEVFGTSTPKGMSDADVFGSGNAGDTGTPVAKGLSDAEVFGSGASGPIAMITDAQRRFTRDLVNVLVTAPLEGYAAKVPSDQTLTAGIERAQRGEDPAQAMEGAIAENRPNLPVKEETGYRAARGIQDYTDALMPDRNILNPVVSDIIGGFGSVAGNIGQSMIPGLRAISIPNIISQGAGQQVEDAIKAGATDEQIRRAARLGDIGGATEFLDLMLPQLGTVGKTAGFLAKVGVRAATGAMIEGGQEGLQQFIQNAIAKGIYDPKRDLIDYGGDNSVLYNAMIGAIVGGGTSAVFGGHGGAKEEAPPVNPYAAPPSVIPGVGSPVTLPVTEAENAPGVPSSAPEAPIPLTQPSATQTAPVTSPTRPEQLSLNLEAPSAPSVADHEASTIPPAIVDHIQRAAPPLQLPEKPAALTMDDLLSPIKEEIQSKPGVNAGRLAKLLGPKLYGDPSNLTPVSIKEMFQNAFDAVKGMLEKGQEDGNIDIKMDRSKRTINIQDDGSGMTPEVLGKQFLEIAGTHKESQRASGGLGIAKMLFIFGNKNLQVTTMRDGKVSTLNTTGEQLFSALNGEAQAPNIQVRPSTTQDLKAFPKGHGTQVQVTVPDQFTDPTTGEVQKIDFDSDIYYHPVLRNSPLFDNIKVTFNGEQLDMGTSFPLENYTSFTNMKTDWGNARIYVSKEPNRVNVYGGNAHVLSNGLWQFDLSVKEDPTKPYGRNVPFEFYIDINPKVSPEDQGYPFDLNRQQFSPGAKDVFGNLLNYMSLLYQQQDMQNSVANFGSMQFLDYDPTTKSVTASENVKVEPKAPPPSNALTLIHPGDKVSVKDGQLVVNGREVPELTPQEIAKFKINPDSLRIPQEEIDPNKIILHDNIDIVVSPVETRSITEYGREKFAKRFDEYVFAMGAAFRELRDAVVKLMPHDISKFTDLPVEYLKTLPDESLPIGISRKLLDTSKNGYEALGKEGIGISADREYRGVSIRIPFAGMFLNPFVPRRADNPVHAAVDMTLTMVHELAHHKERNHGDDGAFQGEFQKILGLLETTPDFNFHAFKQKVVNIVAAYEDVFSHMNGVFTSGDFDIRSRGKRFEDAGAEQTGNGNRVANSDRLGNQPESGSQLSDWVAKGQTIPENESGHSDPSLQIGPSRSTRPSDNGRARNYSALRGVDPGITAPPQQLEIFPIRDGTTKVAGSQPPLKEAAAHADRYNWFYKFMAGVTELLDANPYFEPLRKYVERVRAMHSDETSIHDAAMRISKEWRHLGEQNTNLTALIEDIQTMPYLSPTERKNQAWRHPTPAEFDALAKKHGVDQRAVAVYDKIRKMDETFLRLLEQNAIDQARRNITDPQKLADRFDEIRDMGVQARAMPFFPFTRFGRYAVVVKNAAGRPIHFETFEPKKALGLTIKSAARYQEARRRELEKKLAPGETVESMVLPETAEPLIGLPTLLLQQMQGENIGVTPEMLNAMKVLQGTRNPAMAFKKRAEFTYTKIPGYSLDFQRAFAKYYFHGGRYYAKVRHAWGLRGNIAEAQLSPGNKAGLIASYMGDHLQNTVLDARGDFGAFKGAIFLWAMGYVPAAATQNLTQTPMVTYPFLAAKFGDLRAPAAIAKAMFQVSTYYRKGKLDDMTAFDFKALSYGVKTGRISETQAPELAGIATANNLITGQGGTKFQRGVVAFQEKAAWMFEMAEQFNRRVAYRAALNLALQNPNAKFINESIQKFKSEFDSLIASGHTDTEARAIIAAIATTDQTQFVYAKYARPRLFRGPASILFVFKRYIQSLLYMLGHNKSDVLPRYMMMALLMGGLGGVPGYDDFAGIFHALGRWFFGKDASIDRIVRHYVMQWFDGKVEPDLVLHGLARRGFGIPGLMDLMGSAPGRGLSYGHSQNVPFPIIDRSRAISAGNILPVDIGKMFEPTDKLDTTIANQTQKASGAVFSVGFNLYKALMNAYTGDPKDFKQWEQAMPRALADGSKFYRTYTEGRERGKGGPNSAPTTTLYDTRDTEQMMEVLALLGGYQPLRQQAKWDSILAKAELTSFFTLQKKGLMEQYFEASRGQNPNEIGKVRDEIIKFNQGLPDWGRGMAISADTISKSVQARARALNAKESGTPTQKSTIGISRYVDTLFPETTVDVRRVK